jgi:hypothetical protein
VKRPTVLICHGKACREDKKAFRKLKNTLTSGCKIETVKCQKICSGPVVGCELDGAWTWFEKVRKSEDRKAVLRVIEDQQLSPRARKRRVKKRTGKLR